MNDDNTHATSDEGATDGAQRPDDEQTSAPASTEQAEADLSDASPAADSPEEASTADEAEQAEDAEQVEDAEPDEQAEEATPSRTRGGRSRRATRPASAPEAAEAGDESRAGGLDVLAELGGSARSASAASSASEDPSAALGRIVFEAPSRRSAGQAGPEQPAESGEGRTAQDADEEADGPRLPVTALLFQAPDLSAAPRSRRAQAPAGPPAAPEDEESPAAEDGGPTDKRAPKGDGPKVSAGAETADGGESSQEGGRADGDEGDDDGGESAGGQRRRRRRGGRGRRGRSGGGSGESGATEQDETGDSDETGDAGNGEGGEGGSGEGGDRRPSGRSRGRGRGPAAADAGEKASEADSEGPEGPGEDEGEAEESTQGEASSSSRRRRRRRRGSRSGEGSDAEKAANAHDEVTALKGSTRLEAKRQRRREGREAGRRRTVVTEAEFLARRESVERAMVVRERNGRTQIAVLEDGVLVEHFVARRTQTSMVGNVYLGRVQNVLPSMEAAFVDVGKGRNAVLYAGEVNWDAAGMEGQPRRIEQALSSGDAVMVQVTKDPIGHKGARLTAQITLAGRYLVLVPSGAMTGISRKLPDTERSRLKKILREIVPEGAGVIVRTAAEGASEEELRLDIARLQVQWAEIERKAKSSSAPTLLHGEPDLAIRVVRDVFNEDFGSVVIQGGEAWDAIAGYIESIAPDLSPRLHRWASDDDVFAAHRVDEQLAKALDRKVWLPSGGSLVIDRTEAMTVIDVNTGKFTGSGGTLEETVTRNNLEAAEEIVRQLRLRDIGGIIVIDFIDMVLESNRELVLRRLVECLGRDRTRHQVAEVTSLGLVQMTRKRVGQGLLEAFSESCEACHGRGYLVHSEPVEKAGRAPEAATEEVGRSSSRRRRRSGDAPAAKTAQPTPDLAAREAVKATLATIAAAAAHAHEEAGGTGLAGAPGDDDVTASVEGDEPELVIDFDVIRSEVASLPPLEAPGDGSEEPGGPAAVDRETSDPGEPSEPERHGEPEPEASSEQAAEEAEHAHG